MTTTTCGCGTSSLTPGDATGVTTYERTRYYPRQIVQASDLSQDQTYVRERLRRHNRLLHGWGLVCGARVKVGTKPGTVLVEPGYVLGPFGDEIVIDDVVEVDVTALDLAGDAVSTCSSGSMGADPIDPDPWCADVRVARPDNRPVYLAVSYAEVACRPVAVSASGCGCGCEPDACEYSRIRDSWRIRVLDELPSSYAQTLDPPSFRTAVSCRPATATLDVTGLPVPVDPAACDCPTCATCPTDPWVVLADLTISGGRVTRIDCDAHRRYVASFRDFFYVCGYAGSIGGSIGGVKLPMFTDDVAQRLVQSRDVAGAVAAEPVTGLVLSQPWTPKLTERVGALTVDQVRRQTRDDFVAQMAADLHGAAEDNINPRLGELWDQAQAAWSAVDR